MISQSGLNYPH